MDRLLNITNISASIVTSLSDREISVLLWIIVLATLLLMTILSYTFYHLSKKRMARIRQLMSTIESLIKPLEMIKEPLEELSNDLAINESQKDKLSLAIWSNHMLLKTVRDQIDRENVENKEQSKNKSEEISIQNTESNPKSQPEKNTIRDNTTDILFMEKLFSILHSNLDVSDFTVDTLSAKIGMSRSSLYHRIKDISGQAPADFIRQYRLEKARDLLLTHQYTISEVAYKTGFSDVKYFRTVFKKLFKTNPRNVSKDQG